MKKIILFSFALILGLATQTQAQNDDYRMNVSLSTNYTFTGDIVNTAIDAASTLGETIDKKSLPSLQLTFDYGLTKWFSLGLAASYQKLGFESTGGMTFDTITMTSVVNDYTAKFTRTSIALRPLFHYANNDRLDLYSGLRVQYFAANYSDDSKDPETAGILDLPTRTGFGVGIIPFGARYYITENIGLGTEINIGRPYVVNLSVNARF